MRLIECIHTQSRCYNATNNQIKPVGIIVHSTGSNNTSLKRYVQPSTTSSAYGDLRSLIGINSNGNHWNRNIKKSAHYFIGKLADGSIATVKTLPETTAAWGVGKGKNGSYNYEPTGHIQFEVCEDNLKNESYFKAVYKEATELCADICKRYNWKSDVIVSHKETHSKGYGTNHADIDHWLVKYGLTMNDFRAEVDRLLAPPKPKEEPKPVTNIKVGDKVKLITGATWYTGTSIKSWVFKSTLYVRKLENKSGKLVYLVSTSAKLPIYTGRVYSDFVKKV